MMFMEYTKAQKATIARNRADEKRLNELMLFGPYHESVQKSERESPFKNNNPSYIDNNIIKSEKGQTNLLGEINKLFEQPRAEKWENKRTDDFKFNTAEEQVKKIKKNITPTQQAFKDRGRENYYKSQPGYENTAVEKQNYENNMFQKLADANAKALKEANELQLKTIEEKFKSFQPVASKIPAEDLLIRAERAEYTEQLLEIERARRAMAERELEIMGNKGKDTYYGAMMKTQNINEEKAKITKNVNAEINRYSTMAKMAGYPESLMSDFLDRKRQKAQEEIDALV